MALSYRLTATTLITAGANGASEQLGGLDLRDRGDSAAEADAAEQEQQHGVDSGSQAAAPLQAADAPAADGQQEAAAPAVSPAEMDALLQVLSPVQQQQDMSRSA